MGNYWTVTYVKASAIPEKEIEWLCDRLTKSITNNWYYDEGIKNFEIALDKWIRVNTSHKDYLINQCGKTEDYFTKSNQRKIFKEKLDFITDFLQKINKVKRKEMSLNELLKNSRKAIIIPAIRVEDEIAWVHVQEIFRLRECHDNLTITTIDELIDFLKVPSRQSNITWYTDFGIERKGFSSKFEKIIREYYGKYGDGNFSVQFG